MFNVAVDAINNTEVSKVVVFERIPRYDRVADDPNSVKKDLSELANNYLHELLQKSNLSDRIIIGRHSLDSPSSTRNVLYGEDEGFDGIHLRGPSGQDNYTKSLINIVMNT